MTREERKRTLIDLIAGRQARPQPTARRIALALVRQALEQDGNAIARAILDNKPLPDERRKDQQP